jgi:hypothetical protein
MNHHIMIPRYTYTVIYRHMMSSLSYTFRKSIYRDILSTDIREKYMTTYTRYMRPYDRAWDIAPYTKYMCQWSYHDSVMTVYVRVAGCQMARPGPGPGAVGPGPEPGTGPPGRQ